MTDIGSNIPSVDGLEVLFRNRRIRRLRRLWSNLTQEHGRIPYREDIDPIKLGDFIETAFILERDAENQSIFRLTGQMISHYFGMDMRGQSFLDLIMTQDQSAMRHHIDRLFDEPSILEATLKRNQVVMPLILLPLLDYTGRPNCAIGALIPPHLAPQRYTTFQMGYVHHSDISIMPKEPEKLFAEAQRPFRPAPSTKRPKAAHLRVIK